MDTQRIISNLWFVPMSIFAVLNLILLGLIWLIEKINTMIAWCSDFCESKRLGIGIDSVRQQTEETKLQVKNDIHKHKIG